MIDMTHVNAYCAKQREVVGYKGSNTCALVNACHKATNPLTQASLDSWKQGLVDALAANLQQVAA